MQAGAKPVPPLKAKPNFPTSPSLLLPTLAWLVFMGRTGSVIAHGWNYPALKLMSSTPDYFPSGSHHSHVNVGLKGMSQEGNWCICQELSHTWLFSGILFLPRKHIQIKIGKPAKNLVLLAIDPVALPCLPRNPVTICVHRLIFPPGAPTALSRKC